MTIIYTSSFVGAEELTPEEMPEQFEIHATKLEQVAKEYREMAKFIRDKKIKVSDAKGLPHGGSFVVDDIDTGRLKQAGFVVDFADDPENKEPVFYIDTELDAVLEDETYLFKDEEEDEDLSENEIAQLFGTDYEDDLEPDFEENLLKGIAPEKIITFKLQDLVNEDPPEEDSILGTVQVGVEPIDDERAYFHIIVPDVGPEFKRVSFDREKCRFKYKCEGCPKWHYVALESAYRSIRTASALISNVIGLVQHEQDVSTAFEAVDRDLRLLQSLVREDYAIADDDEE